MTIITEVRHLEAFWNVNIIEVDLDNEKGDNTLVITIAELMKMDIFLGQV